MGTTFPLTQRCNPRSAVCNLHRLFQFFPLYCVFLLSSPQTSLLLPLQAQPTPQPCATQALAATATASPTQPLSLATASASPTQALSPAAPPLAAAP